MGGVGAAGSHDIAAILAPLMRTGRPGPGAGDAWPQAHTGVRPDGTPAAQAACDVYCAFTLCSGQQLPGSSAAGTRPGRQPCRRCPAVGELAQLVLIAAELWWE
jgi:hypothetical protein